MGFIKKFYYSPKYKKWSGCISDIIALKHDLKTLSVLRGDKIRSKKAEEDILFLKNLCKPEGIFLDYLYYQGWYFVYLTKKEKIRRWVKKYLGGFSTVSSREMQLGLKLGYPACCVKKYLKNHEEKIRYFIPREINTMPFLNNHLFGAGGSNIKLSEHVPCSYLCGVSIKYNDKLLSAIRAEEKNYFFFLDENLKKPFLLWANDYHYDSLESSCYAALFDGDYKDGIIKYDNIFYSYPTESYSHIKYNNIPQKNKVLALSQGDHVVLNMKSKKIQSLLVYKNEKKIKEIKLNQDTYFVQPV